MNTDIYEQTETISETLRLMDLTFKFHFQQFEEDLKTLEAAVEQLELRLRNLRNEG